MEFTRISECSIDLISCSTYPDLEFVGTYFCWRPNVKKFGVRVGIISTTVPIDFNKQQTRTQEWCKTTPRYNTISTSKQQQQAETTGLWTDTELQWERISDDDAYKLQNTTKENNTATARCKTGGRRHNSHLDIHDRQDYKYIERDQKTTRVSTALTNMRVRRNNEWGYIVSQRIYGSQRKDQRKRVRWSRFIIRM